VEAAGTHRVLTIRKGVTDIPMLVKTRSILVIGLLLTMLALIAILALPTSFLRIGCSLLLGAFLPGWGLVEGLFALSGRRPQWSERLLFGWGAGYAITVVGGLWLYYIFGQMSLLPLLALYMVVGLVGFGLALIRRGRSALARPFAPELTVLDIGWLLGLFALAAFLTLSFLSYADYRGDEAEVMMRAVAVIRGVGQPIFTHTKGPAETLLTAAFGLLNGGVFDEFSTRLPFGLANCLAVTAIYLLGRTLFGRRVAMIGGALAAINGWLIAYGHIAQYQAPVVLLSALAVWCYGRFYQEGSHVYHGLGTLFLAAATFGHYDGATAAPALLYLLIVGLKLRGLWGRHLWQDARKMWPVALSLLMGVAIVLSFYAPYILRPTVVGAEKLATRLFGADQPYNNWDDFYVNGLFYNSIYYVLGIGGMLLGGTLYGIRRAGGDGRWGTSAAAGALPLLLLSRPGLLPPWYALLVYLGLMGLFLFSRRVSVSVRAMLLWLLLPFALYLFAMLRPGNHYYILMPPLALLAALTMDRGLRWLEQIRPTVQRWAVPGVLGVSVALYGLSAGYLYVVYVRADLEYLFTYPQHRVSAFWSDPRYPFDIRIGLGFPYRLGWQTVSELYRSGQLAGDWYGTDEDNSIDWYTLGALRNPCYPRHFIVTEIGHKEPPLKVPQDTIDRYYALRAVVQVNGQPRLRLYEFAPLGNQSQPVIYSEPARYPTLYRQEMLQGDPLAGPVLRPFASLIPARQFKPHPDMLARMADVYGDPRIVQAKDEATLLGYDVDDTWAVPGGVLLLTLYWQADHRPIFSYKVFAHVTDGGDGGRMLAQADSEPGCGELPTNRWEAGAPVVDRHAIFLPADMPSGTYSLDVGLYEPRTNLRMDVLDSAGNPAGNSLLLDGVTVRPKR
jgi:4-amino-4-deoxy-L-arabinose transferase-like glycosyltransferase